MPDPNVNKSTGSGASASISTDSGSTWKSFGAVSGITGPTMTRGTVDVSTLNSYSSNDKMKEFLPDFVEGGDCTINGFYTADDEGRTTAETAFYGDSEVQIKIVLPTRIGKTYTLTGIPTSYQCFGEISPSAGIAYSVTVKLTKKPTVAASAA